MLLYSSFILYWHFTFILLPSTQQKMNSNQIADDSDIRQVFSDMHFGIYIDWEFSMVYIEIGSYHQLGNQVIKQCFFLSILPLCITDTPEQCSCNEMRWFSSSMLTLFKSILSLRMLKCMYFRPWKKTNPDNFAGQEHCGEFVNAELNDVNCFAPLPYVCEKKKCKYFILS
jgi:hypothetical protein